MHENNNLLNIRSLMHHYHLDAYIITMSDPHLSEYVAEHWKTIKWFSGFSGSTGNIIVTQNFAGLWTDSRYFVQAEDQLKGTGINLVKLKIAHTPEFIDWINEHVPAGSTIAFDGKVFPINLVKTMESKLLGKKMKLETNIDLIAKLWENRPSMPYSEIFVHELKFAGKTCEEKLKSLRARMKAQNMDYLIISGLDDIAWLYNIRGKDIPYVPLAICYSIISQNESMLFIDDNKVPDNIRKEIEIQGITINRYDEIFNYTNRIEAGKRVSIQFSKTNYTLYKAIPENCILTDNLNITTILKAIKNDVEISNIKETMVKDGLAMVKYLYWLNNTIGKERVTEISASEKLRTFRAEQESFFVESFAPISAYNAHSAMPHYCAAQETDTELKVPGIYLIDSGGQYFGGTTDITRTIALGNPTERQKNDFTLELKGTINLANAVFPIGTKGFQLDILARKPLWDNGMNYGHGTGHGVGYFLNVHEGPQTIGTSASGDLNTVLLPGMLTSDEPAFYRDGEYGFRTENLILVVEHKETEFGKFLKFETVTLCPIDLNLINKNLLDNDEVEWLNTYHTEVYNKLSSFLSKNEKQWLKENTRAI